VGRAPTTRTFARAGYAVVLPTARGFGRSCGVADSRTAGCERGWIHVDDQRFEVRDVQWLLGLLVDQRVARPAALGVIGVSYGAGTSLQLALLGNHIRRPDGGYAPWTSPAGTPLASPPPRPAGRGATSPDALTPSGRLGLDTYASPIGVPIEAYVDALYGIAATGGYVAPPGADASADLTTWKRLSDQGEPFGAPERRRCAS
jgi:pimeloyl-ACP methyl ester carboxylesterase